MADTPINDYYLIGGLRSSALISKEGSIDWLCLPYFDSPSIFARLLGSGGGSFSLDTQGFTLSSHYVPETAIVELNLVNQTTEVKLHDFMVPLDIYSLKTSQYLVRSVECKKGKASLTFKLDPEPDFARGSVHWQVGKDRLIAAFGQGTLIVHLPSRTIASRKPRFGFDITLNISSNETKDLILEYQPIDHAARNMPKNLEKITADFWRDWVKKGNFVNFCRDRLVRSAITLKLMQFAPTGAIVAAPTTSLPETIGGVRNWDYRYVWIRDATFTLYALHTMGYFEEAERFFDFIHTIIEKCAERQFDISLMYTIFGESVPDETSLVNLSGYKGSKPVRLGNGAALQFQLDVYGSLIDAVYFAAKRGLTSEHKGRMRKLVVNLVEKIEQTWQNPDSGIWEVRAGEQDFTYSKVMCWVGAERAVRLKDVLGLTDGDIKRCQNLASNIKNWIWKNCYDKKLGNFSQYPASKAIDATNYLFVLLQFLDKHDPETNKIIEATRKELCHHDVFVYRYLNQDGLPGKEGAFLLCSFWLISALAILENTKEARALFDKLEKFLAPNGLIAEEIDPASGQYLGNYPQAFSHIGYIMSAYYIDRYSHKH